MNPIADEDHNHLGSDYKTQFSTTGPQDPWVENYSNITYFCSRKHDWEGLITDASSGYGIPDAPQQHGGSEYDDQLNFDDEDGYKVTETDPDYQDRVSGIFIVSQWLMIEDKNNGIGDLIIADQFWTKKSTHVVFRRPLTVESDETMNLKIGGKYNFFLQWGLFDNSTDEDVSKLNGNIDMNDFESLTIVPISN